ncbi:MAG: hypothetical protein IPK73_27995 [Candidatus Obscuribacter sp.]|nr:hypothetical protein [Candidatus Obscuribacter sp.]
MAVTDNIARSGDRAHESQNVDWAGNSTHVNLMSDVMKTVESGKMSNAMSDAGKGGKDNSLVGSEVEKTIVSADNDVQKAFGGKGDSITLDEASKAEREKAMDGKSFDAASLYNKKDSANMAVDPERDKYAAAYYAANVMGDASRQAELSKAFDNAFTNNPHLQQPDQQREYAHA